MFQAGNFSLGLARLLDSSCTAIETKNLQQVMNDATLDLTFLQSKNIFNKVTTRSKSSDLLLG